MSEEKSNISDTTILYGQPIHDIHWTYRPIGKLVSMEKWFTKFPDCGGKRQSPINIVTSKVVKNKSLNIKFSGYYTKLTRCYVENNGHTVSLAATDSVQPFITGSSLNNEVYQFKQMHFHWGMRKNIGSEHFINGKPTALELHLVHFNTKYGTYEKAVMQPDGLAVLGVLYRLSLRKNKYLTPLLKYTSRVVVFRDKISVKDPIVLRNFLPGKLKPFYVYPGSLTTPPCSEIVTWIVFRNFATISRQQEALFRRERGEHKDPKTGKYLLIGNNFRTPLSLNGRVVFTSSS